MEYCTSSIMFGMFTHIITRATHGFILWIAEEFCMVYYTFCLHTHHMIDLDYFQIGAIPDAAAENIYVQVFVWTAVFTFLR